MMRGIKNILGRLKFTTKRSLEAVIFLMVFFAIFGYLAHVMGLPNMLNTIMNTSYDLLINTVFYIMGITVLSGALGKLLIEFGVVRMLETLFKPLIRPLFNLPGVAALGAVMTFLSDNPAIMSLTKDKNFSHYFKKHELISLTNFSTAFGMGLVVIVFMAGKGYAGPAIIGLFGAIVGGIVATRLMQFFVLRKHPEFKDQEVGKGNEQRISYKSNESIFIRVLNSVLDGGKTGVELGLAIIPGVLIISTFVMILTFGPSSTGDYSGAAKEGVALLPFLAGKLDFLFEGLFGFHHPELVSFPITALGAVGAALGLVPSFIEQGFIDNNAIAVFTAMGMCWSGFLSTHTAMLDQLGYRDLISKDIITQIIGGICAGVSAHWFYVLFQALFG